MMKRYPMSFADELIPLNYLRVREMGKWMGWDCRIGNEEMRKTEIKRRNQGEQRKRGETLFIC